MDIHTPRKPALMERAVQSGDWYHLWMELNPADLGTKWGSFVNLKMFWPEARSNAKEECNDHIGGVV